VHLLINSSILVTTIFVEPIFPVIELFDVSNPIFFLDELFIIVFSEPFTHFVKQSLKVVSGDVLVDLVLVTFFIPFKP